MQPPEFQLSLNGLFPVIRIARKLKLWQAPQLRRLNERAERLFVAGYVLHDWLKLPSTHEKLEAAGLRHDQINPVKHRELVEQIFQAACYEFGIEAFLSEIGGSALYLHDLIYIACNTQVKWGTMRNLGALPNLQLDGPTLGLCEQLSRLADYIVYVGRNPRATVGDPTITKTLTLLSEGKARLVCHHVTESIGVLTNLVHNAAMTAMRHEGREPILFAPSGVVYLQREGTPDFPSIANIAHATIQHITQAASASLRLSGKGLTRGPIGIKVPEVFKELFAADDFVQVMADAVLSRAIPAIKPSKAAERYKKIRDDGRVAAQWLDPLPVDIQVDQLAEWCHLCDLVLRDSGIAVNTSNVLLAALKLTDDEIAAFHTVPRENKITGGLGLHWFFAAGRYRLKHTGLDPAAWAERMSEIAKVLAQAVGPHPLMANPWQDTHTYITQLISFLPKQDTSAFALASPPQRNNFMTELNNYSNAKRAGRGSSLASSLRPSSFENIEQRETSQPFAPQVYSSKLSLHSSKAIRGIDPISNKELMLRQIFMSRVNSIGGKFEGLKIRYLYFYPTYFFSPETLDVFKDLYDKLQRVSLTQIRKSLVNEDSQPPQVRFDAESLQKLEEMLLMLEIPESGDDRMIRMRFPDDTPITFYFIGIQPGRDPSDSEAWVAPVLLSLLLPLCMDVKVVASESTLPLLNQSDDMQETVLLDGAHAFAQNILRHTRLNIDQVYPALKRLLTAYFIHLDANSRKGAKGFDYNWSKLPQLARDLSATALYVFQHLKRWQRNWQRKQKLDVLPIPKAQLYLSYANEIDPKGHDMTIARDLVSKYRAFYRAKKYNSNSILQPLSVVSRAILTADRLAFGDADSLSELAQGQLAAFMERVQKGSADGRLAFGSDGASRNIAMHDFANYFVRDVFFAAFRGDRAALRGKQLNLIKSACEAIYRDLDAKDRAAHQEQIQEDTEEDN